MIWLIPIEDRKTRVKRALLEYLGIELKKTFHQDCEIHRALRPPIFSRVAGSDRYTGARLLEALPIEKDALILGVTNLDLSMLGYDYTSGLSDLPNHRAIISVYRLQSDSNGTAENEEKVAERFLKRATHELGHTLGLSHCEDTSCVMNYSDAVEDIDKKSRIFCEKCEAAFAERLQPHSHAV